MTNVLALADEIEAAYARRQPMAEPPSARAAGLTLDQAYAVEAELARRRHAAGHATVGRKVGFANKALWRVMGLSTGRLGGHVRRHGSSRGDEHTSLRIAADVLAEDRAGDRDEDGDGS